MTDAERPKGEKKELTRRALIERGILVGAVVLPYAIGETLKGLDRLENRVYRSGETIKTPVGDVKIHGWRLRFLDKTFRGARDPYKFWVVNPDSTNQPMLMQGAGMLAGRHEEDGEKFWEIPSFPPNTRERAIYLHLTQFDETGDEQVWNKVYPIKLSFSTHDEEGDYDRPLVFSEKDIGAPLLERIHNSRKALGEYVEIFPLYLYDSMGETEERGGRMSPEEERVELPDIVFTKPKFRGEGEQFLFHEDVHGFVHQVQMNFEDQVPYVRMVKAYEELVRAAGFKTPMHFGLGGPPDSVENAPLFRVFDESFYLAKDPETGFKHPHGHGHPYSNATELMASAMTVLRFFPDAFVSEYRKLHDIDRMHARAVVVSIFDMLKHINPHANTEGLFAGYAAIARAIGYESR